MKHLRQYENYFDDVNLKWKDFYSLKIKIQNMISEFVSIDDEFKKNHSNLIGLDCYDYSLTNGKLSASFDYEYDVEFTPVEFKNLLIYMENQEMFKENPEMYNNTKQYNI